MDVDEVLVLNHNYQPLNVTNMRRAVLLICTGKAHALENDSRVLHSAHLDIEMPTVLRLNHSVRRPVPPLRASRRAILARDEHTCQYCGQAKHPLTLDHVIPRDRGGVTDWENLVCCCTQCNNLKGNLTPEQAGIRLVRKPTRPRYLPYIPYTKFLAAVRNPVWLSYLAPYCDAQMVRRAGK